MNKKTKNNYKRRKKNRKTLKNKKGGFSFFPKTKERNIDLKDCKKPLYNSCPNPNRASIQGHLEHKYKDGKISITPDKESKDKYCCKKIIRKDIVKRGTKYIKEENENEISWRNEFNKNRKMLEQIFTGNEIWKQPLPPGWEEQKTEDGTPFFIDHNTEQTTWDHPSALDNFFAPATGPIDAVPIHKHKRRSHKRKHKHKQLSGGAVFLELDNDPLNPLKNREHLNYLSNQFIREDIFDRMAFATLSPILQRLLLNDLKKKYKGENDPYFLNNPNAKYLLIFQLLKGPERHPLKIYNYCGPGTNVQQRQHPIMHKFTPLYQRLCNHPVIGSHPYNKGINPIDKCCEKHDLYYSLAKDLNDEDIADTEMLKCIESNKDLIKNNPDFLETLIDKALITGTIHSKAFLTFLFKFLGNKEIMSFSTADPSIPTSTKELSDMQQKLKFYFKKKNEK